MTAVLCLNRKYVCALSITVYGQLVHNKNTMNPTEAFMELREANLAECNKTYRLGCAVLICINPDTKLPSE